MNLSLAGKTAIISGGTAGIGFRIARALAAEGARVAICGRDEDRLAGAVAELRQLGTEVLGLRRDVTDATDVQALVEEVFAWSSTIDVLINNVGGSEGGDLLHATDEEWHATFERNLFQAIRMIRMTVPRMPPGGAIVNVASISGWIGQLSGTLQYGAAKAALIFLTEPLALQLARYEIRVNTVSPGSITWEGGGWDRFATRQPEVYAAYVKDGFPAGRLGRPDEVADVVAFLASPRARWVNGKHIGVDGLQQPIPAEDRRLWGPADTTPVDHPPRQSDIDPERDGG